MSREGGIVNFPHGGGIFSGITQTMTSQKIIGGVNKSKK